MPKSIVFIFLLSFGHIVFAADFRSENITFTSHSTELSGTLILPEHQSIIAAVVFVHGSGKQTRNIALAKRFAEDGIAALVYDKRGAGSSGGEYEEKYSVSEKNLSLLADDARSALDLLEKHPKLKGVPLGLTGISQAGWIVPLAAIDASSLSFMAIWSGPVCKVSEEDIYSKYTKDLDGPSVPSFEEALNSRMLPYVWPFFLGKDTSPSESLAKLNVPGLWVFGAKDGSVPIDLSIQRLDDLSSKGLDYSYVLFSDEGHNNMRTTFATVTAWIASVTRASKES